VTSAVRRAWDHRWLLTEEVPRVYITTEGLLAEEVGNVRTVCEATVSRANATVASV
jgi:hypothetical protein